MRGGEWFFEAVTTGASATSHLVNISLVYWKSLTHLQPKFIIGAAESPLCQHGAIENE
jgi:hypothetical protein